MFNNSKKFENILCKVLIRITYYGINIYVWMTYMGFTR